MNYKQNLNPVYEWRLFQHLVELGNAAGIIIYRVLQDLFNMVLYGFDSAQLPWKKTNSFTVIYSTVENKRPTFINKTSGGFSYVLLV